MRGSGERGGLQKFIWNVSAFSFIGNGFSDTNFNESPADVFTALLVVTVSRRCRALSSLCRFVSDAMLSTSASAPDLGETLEMRARVWSR